MTWIKSVTLSPTGLIFSIGCRQPLKFGPRQDVDFAALGAEPAAPVELLQLAADHLARRAKLGGKLPVILKRMGIEREAFENTKLPRGIIRR